MPEDNEKSGLSEPDALPELIDQLPADRRAALKEALARSEGESSVTIASAYFSGPLPPAAQLEGYQKIDAEFPNRIMAMAEKEQNHRHDKESLALKSAINFEKRGQLYTLLISGMVISGGAFMAFIGYAVAGIALLAAPLVGLAAQLISGHRRSRKNKEQEAG